ncbi:hypothetical protein K2173_016594 [Erythroxylum novogranatense]|uniref:Uncharacterized protein n=1 Tax=Erythroxylum novogranatense TaxID=1862640 RepID=A0AAV8SS16_9ROSI|nr:hypothetical protein K2173_016594 [Erythroxylum novogranatense]
MDSATTSLKRPNIALAQIEIDLLKERPQKIWIDVEGSEDLNTPPQQTNSPKTTRQEYVPKSQGVTNPQKDNPELPQKGKGVVMAIIEEDVANSAYLDIASASSSTKKLVPEEEVVKEAPSLQQTKDPPDPRNAPGPSLDAPMVETVSDDDGSDSVIVAQEIGLTQVPKY